MSADRARRPGTWAAAVGSAGTPADPPAPRLADVVRHEVREAVGAAATATRDAVTTALAEIGRADPARVHARRLRRSQVKARFDAATAVGFAAVTGVAVAAATPVAAEAGLGAVTVAAGWHAVRSSRRLAVLRRAPVPPARAPRPPKDSPARGPLERLGRQEQALHALLGHLGEFADEPRRVAVSAAAGLRDLGARLTAVDRAHRLSGGLADAVGALRRQLDAGLGAYDALVVAAGDAVAADAGRRGPDPALQDATDTLAGLAAGFRALA